MVISQFHTNETNKRLKFYHIHRKKSTCREVLEGLSSSQGLGFESRGAHAHHFMFDSIYFRFANAMFVNRWALTHIFCLLNTINFGDPKLGRLLV